MSDSRKELSNLLKSKLREKRINRTSKLNKELILDKTLKELGIEKDKFKADLEAVKKQGGLEINLKQ
jgi:alcohol dehydrogenase class IV